MKNFSTTVSRVCGPVVFALAFATAPAVHADGNFYRQHNLVSDGFVPADHTDLKLINGWGVVFNPFGPIWVADNNSGVSTIYDGLGIAAQLVVNIPSPSNRAGGGTPTGIVFNASTGFEVSKGNPARFIFATEDGLITAWAPTVDLTHAITVVDNSASAVYKGLALSAGGTGSLLYAADFHNARIDVFDSSFKPVELPMGAFTDPTIPVGFAPFGLQAINGDIYVAYAKQNPAKHDDVAGKGFGFVNVFDPNGHLIRRVASGGKLNAPWGMTLAPAGFGKFSNRLLIGNFGDGMINAYDLATGRFVGRLKAPDGRPIKIDGLWGITFGNGFVNAPVNTLFFAAGPGAEQHGLYGRLDVAPGDAHDVGPDADDAD
jgi:uncharacterized protein (TIGR03118 family)